MPSLTRTPAGARRLSSGAPRMRDADPYIEVPEHAFLAGLGHKGPRHGGAVELGLPMICLSSMAAPQQRSHCRSPVSTSSLGWNGQVLQTAAGNSSASTARCTRSSRAEKRLDSTLLLPMLPS
jgi:hypothetical protein